MIFFEFTFVFRTDCLGRNLYIGLSFSKYIKEKFREVRNGKNIDNFYNWSSSY